MKFRIKKKITPFKDEYFPQVKKFLFWRYIDIWSNSSIVESFPFKSHDDALAAIKEYKKLNTKSKVEFIKVD